MPASTATDHAGQCAGGEVVAAPRRGLFAQPEDRVRGGYGLYWAPWNYQAPSSGAQLRPGRLHAEHHRRAQTASHSDRLADQPVPERRGRAAGNSLGALTGVGTQHQFVDQTRRAAGAAVLGRPAARAAGNMAITFELLGARGDDLALGGSNDTPININQLDPKYLALGRGAERPAAEPVLRQPERAGCRCRRRPTLPRAHCCGRSRSSATSTCARSRAARATTTRRSSSSSKRMTHGWGGRFNYTYSLLKDNQFGESNFYAAVSPAADEQLQLPGDGAGVRATSSSRPPATTRTPTTATASSTCRIA